LGQVALLIDECLSPALARDAESLGFAAAHCRDRGLLGLKDHEIAKRCFEEGLVLVTHNAGDFRKLLGKAELHPGLVILQENVLQGSRLQLKAALQHIERASAGDSTRYMVNRVVFVDQRGTVSEQELPTGS
jgi:predicted nuclease of predicted toxin-antitoxin system